MYYFKLFYYTQLILDTSKIPTGLTYNTVDQAIIAAKDVCVALNLSEHYTRIVPLPYEQVIEPRVFTVKQIAEWLKKEDTLGFTIGGARTNLTEKAIMNANKPKESPSSLVFQEYVDYVASTSSGITALNFDEWLAMKLRTTR